MQVVQENTSLLYTLKSCLTPVLDEILMENVTLTLYNLHDEMEVKDT